MASQTALTFLGRGGHSLRIKELREYIEMNAPLVGLAPYKKYKNCRKRGRIESAPVDGPITGWQPVPF